MSEGAAAISAETELHRLLIEGGLRKSFGLLREDLQLGLTIARNQMTRGAHRDALRSYATMVLLDPIDVEFQLGLANCAAVVGEYTLCLQAASAAIALAPRNARAYYFSGRACLALGHFTEAEEDLRDAISFGLAAADAVIVQQAEVLLAKSERVNG